MSSYYEYQDDADYAKEIYWEAKGMGYGTPSTETPKQELKDTQCAKCQRWGTSTQVASHNLNHPDCDK